MYFCLDAISNFDSEQRTTEIAMKNFSKGIQSWPCLVFCLFDPVNQTTIIPDGLNIKYSKIKKE